ncbi:MAG: T9SS C-terminal target domain-containing protein [Cytophagaceae bacterium]
MKKLIRSVLVSIMATAVLVSCKPPEDDEQTTSTSDIVLEGNLTTQTLDGSKKYLLKGLVYVNDGVTLTIPAGTIIKGDKASKAALVVNRGGKLEANGTAANPVIFTSAAPKGYRNAGDWGGIILCGKAKNNQSVNQVIEGPTDFSTTSGNGVYGGDGTHEDDNSGTLQYVRIEYAGIAYSPDKEINSLTMGSVGSGTTIDHILVSYGGDDSFEWFGGTVDAKYLISYVGYDDDFDTDFGFSGKVQFGVVMRNRGVADVSQSNSFESDNDASGSSNTPKTSAKFSNITVMGPRTFNKSNNSANFVQAIHARRNTEITIANSIVTGFTNMVNFDKYSGTSRLKNNLFAEHNNSTQANASLFVSGNSNDTTGFYAANKWGIKTSVANIFADTILENGNPVQVSAGLGLTGADFTATTGLTETFWTSTTYLGAMGTSAASEWNWTSGWLNFAPQNTEY